MTHLMVIASDGLVYWASKGELFGDPVWKMLHVVGLKLHMWRKFLENGINKCSMWVFNH